MTTRFKGRDGQKVIATNMMKNKQFKKVWMILMALAAFSAIFHILQNSRIFLPRWIVWKNSTLFDQTGRYEIILDNKTVHVKYENNLIWNTSDEIKVQKALSSDIDNDCEEELVLLCWKKGRFGRHRPFWTTEDEKVWSQHIFVYEYSPQKVIPKWMSSYLGQDVKDIFSNHKDAPDSRLWLMDLEKNMSSWVWNTWGFSMEDTQLSFLAFGDILVHEPIYQYGLQNDESFGFLFENVKDCIENSDIAVINQETPLTDKPSLYSDYPRFGTPVHVGRAIVDAGFDVVTCATNHALDQGEKGVCFTKNFFEENQIICLGIQTTQEQTQTPYVILQRKGVRFALLNYTYGTNGILPPQQNPNMVWLLSDKDKIQDDIKKAKSQADFVIVFVHWGTENTEQIDEFQQEWAQIFLDCKADVVVGTHPHALQPYGMLADDSGHQMLIYYSIGNFISAQPERQCIKGGMAEFKIELTPEGYRITKYGLHPLKITWHKGRTYTTDF